MNFFCVCGHEHMKFAGGDAYPCQECNCLKFVQSCWNCGHPTKEHNYRKEAFGGWYRKGIGTENSCLIHENSFLAKKMGLE